ncbi:MAG: gamma-glutamylcyclotransferase [Amylibacter sp.]|jgi:cation transport protein ChaC|tara:strand:- start:492 stop:1040 length:549 start_codon:yes stop_codon:yes gene_type:complete
MNGQDIWIFGYGSLVWQPGFEYAQQEIGRLQNYKRSFCMWSIHYRGTPKNKGLVLALDKVQGAVCEGLLFRVRAKNVDKVLAYLRKRELISEAYLEVIIDVELDSGEIVKAYTYIVNRQHEQYAGSLTIEDQAIIINSAKGSIGPNNEYLFNVTRCLRDLNIKDLELEDLSARTLLLSSKNI